MRKLEQRRLLRLLEAARQELAARVYRDGRAPIDLSAYDSAREAG